VTKKYIRRNTYEFLLGLRQNSVHEQIQMELHVCIFKASENRLNFEYAGIIVTKENGVRDFMKTRTNKR
jgi:hypothetical protein